MIIGLDRTKYNPRDPLGSFQKIASWGQGWKRLISQMTFEHCTRLQTVDISRTGIQEIVGSAFAGCSQLQCIKLSHTLRRIGREAFRKCSSLEVLHTPPALLYINKRAFADCTQLCRLVRMGNKGKKGTWRGTHIEHKCLKCVPN